MTRASDTKPVRRVVTDGDGREYVLTVRHRYLTLRPIRTRQGGPAEATRTYGQVYLDAMCGGPLASRPRRARRVRR